MAAGEFDSWNASLLRSRLLAWYTVHQRDLPWRRSRDPYCIWVSEIMLQQTRVAVVIERYHAFLAHFPTVEALARASEQDVLALWSGLGYYRRARMLHKAAQAVVELHQGHLPQTAAELRMLPGIGAYTAAAIASIAGSEAVAVVDGNVERVLLRLAGWEAGDFKGAAALRQAIDRLAAHLVDVVRPGDFNQAMMELGATVCTPRNPQCLVCPLSASCKTRGEHKTTPRPRMTKREIGYALCLRVARGRKAVTVLLEQRGAQHTVMPGLWELPTLREAVVPPEDLRMTVRHAIMNVNYVVSVRAVAEQEITALTIEGSVRRWVPVDEAGTMALTGLARKILTRAHLLEKRVRHPDSKLVPAE